MYQFFFPSFLVCLSISQTSASSSLVAVDRCAELHAVARGDVIRFPNFLRKSRFFLESLDTCLIFRSSQHKQAVLKAFM